MKIFERLPLTSTLYALLLCFGLLACTDDEDAQPAPQQPGEVKGVVRPVGNPTGAIFMQEVGPEGGKLALADGRVVIDVPAGAVTAPVEISIQEIENTNHAGLGKSFRLTPHGEQFQKPVSISFSYAGQEAKIPAAKALGMAFQGEDGVWNFVGNPVVDETKKTVTVQSTHFSDWTIMLWMHILPLEASIEIGDEIELTAVRFVPVTVDEDGLLTALVPPAGWVPVGEHVPVEDKYIGKWSFAGAGVLVSSGNVATYKAPLFVPEENPVAVSLQLSSQEEQIILVSNITISGNQFEFRIDGGAWIQMDVLAAKLKANEFGIAGAVNGASVSLHWNGGVGHHAYTKDLDWNTLFQYWPNLNLAYTHWYDTDSDYGIISGGGINITSMGETDGWVTGTFTVSPSGMISSSTGKQVGTASIEGRFRVRKSW